MATLTFFTYLITSVFSDRDGTLRGNTRIDSLAHCIGMKGRLLPSIDCAYIRFVRPGVCVVVGRQRASDRRRSLCTCNARRISDSCWVRINSAILRARLTIGARTGPIRTDIFC